MGSLLVEWYEIDIADFASKCPNREKVKAEHQKTRGMTQKNVIATWKWEIINMDFIIGLHHTHKQYDSIWVIVARMTKSSHFLAVKTTDLAEFYAKLDINEILRLHGVTFPIILDRSPEFISHFWHLFQKCLGTQVNLRISFYP